MKRLLATIFCTLLLIPSFAHAQGIGGLLTSEVDKSGTEIYGPGGAPDAFEVIGNLIAIILSILGVILLVLIVYAGFLWMTAAGNDKRVAQAKEILINAIVGLVLTLAAFGISTFVVGALENVNNGSQAGTTTQTPPAP